MGVRVTVIPGDGIGPEVVAATRRMVDAAGADVEYVFKDQGGNLRAETTTSVAPVIAVIFGQAGLLVGATLEGVKYTRIIP